MLHPPLSGITEVTDCLDEAGNVEVTLTPDQAVVEGVFEVRSHDRFDTVIEFDTEDVLQRGSPVGRGSPCRRGTRARCRRSSRRRVSDLRDEREGLFGGPDVM